MSSTTLITLGFLFCAIVLAQEKVEPGSVLLHKLHSAPKKAKSDAALIPEDVQVNIAIRHKKDGRDLWDVSRLLLEDGVQRSLLGAIKTNLGLSNSSAAGREELSGIKRSLKRTFQRLQDSAVHVDPLEKDDKDDVVVMSFDPKHPMGWIK